MEPVAAPPTEEKDTPSPNPVMDIRPPKSGDAPEPPHDTTESKPATNAMGQDDKSSPARPPKNPAPAQPKEPHSGVGLAVVATVIIVLGLGAMMVYAYLRSNNL